jgi:hypothetical protein
MDTGHEIHAIVFPGVGSQLLAITRGPTTHKHPRRLFPSKAGTRGYGSLLRKAWLNLDLVWAVARIATAGLTLFLS